MTTRRQIRLLGPFQVTLDGEAVTQFGSDTARALLAYLALHPGIPHRRDALAGLLWPEQSDAEAVISGTECREGACVGIESDSVCRPAARRRNLKQRWLWRESC